VFESEKLSDRPISIAFVVTNFSPRSGGVESHVAGLTCELVRRGHHVTVITLDDEVGETVEAGVRVVRLARRWSVGSVLAFPRFGSYRRIRSAVRSSGAMAISTHTRFFPMSFLGVRIGRSLGVPVIHTEHGSGFVSGVSPAIALASRLVDRTIGVAVLKRSTVVLGVSQAVVNFVRQLSGVQATVFSNAIDVSSWRRAAAGPQRELAPKRLVYVGRLVAGKGWQSTLEAAESLLARLDGHPFELHFCGDGPQLSELRRRVERSSVSELTRVHGRLSVPELAPLLRNAILVNPTTLSEGFQTTLIEALVCGAQIVTTEVPGVRELMERGAAITVVPRGERSLLAAALYEALSAQPSALAESVLDEWSWAAQAKQYEKLLQRVVSPPGLQVQPSD
jgi:glycosyltransferase involved in cell wall biosynthesis